MRISLNKIKEYVSIPDHISDQELIDLIGSRLVEVEEAIDLAPKYRGIYIAKVVKCEPIPDTHLNLCQIDAGGNNQSFNQLDNGLIQVVCGAPNVHAGMLAVWITPGAIVPETYGGENFRLSVRKLRGYESNGMLAGADELGFSDEHKTIAEIDPKVAQPGDSFAEVFGLNDIILDVENKSLTHRPDCFGLIGFAREVAGILDLKFIEPEVFTDRETLPMASELPLKVEIKDSELCPRYTCAVFDLSENQPSKYFTKTAAFLAKSGMRSIDPMVDLTNILMLEAGQPLHAFDYDKLITVGGTKTPKIIIRAAREQEELQLLDGKTIQCTPDDILITSNDTPIALAGAMGGKNTEVDASTKRIVLESATFSLYNLRKTQMAHGIFSEAITRFTKGQPAEITSLVLAEALKRLAVQPLAIADDYPNKTPETVVKITTTEVNSLLGTTYTAETMQTTLENVGFKVSQQSDTLTVTAPLWRTDIHIKEDIIEEIGRLLGYDNIPLQLPKHPFIEAKVDPMFAQKTELRNILSCILNMHEVLTYSFVNRSLIERVGEDPAESYEITNSISPDLQCFRQQIVPSLLDKIRENLKAGYRDFDLYEMNQVTLKSNGLTDEGVPVMQTHLGIVSLGDFYQLKAKLLTCFRELKLPLTYRALSNATAPHYPYLEPKHSAEILLQDQVIGAFGEVKQIVLNALKLDQTISALELNLEPVVNAPRMAMIEHKLSKFPFVGRDITLKVSSDAPFGRFYHHLDELLQNQGLIYEVTPISLYQATENSATKNLSFHLKFSNPEKTLNSDEISAIMKKVTIALSELGAEIV